MGLVDGYYGTADMFEFNSRHTKFPRGFGLPGRTWKAGMPLIIKDLHNSKGFLRWEEASEIGINCGVGIPYRTSAEQTWVMTLLSAQATPIAQRFEIWVPNADRSALVFQSGDCSKGTDLDALYAAKASARATARSAAPGRPACRRFAKICSTMNRSRRQLARAAGMNQMVALPVIEACRTEGRARLVSLESGFPSSVRDPCGRPKSAAERKPYCSLRLRTKYGALP